MVRRIFSRLEERPARLSTLRLALMQDNSLCPDLRFMDISFHDFGCLNCVACYALLRFTHVRCRHEPGCGPADLRSNTAARAQDVPATGDFLGAATPVFSIERIARDGPREARVSDEAEIRKDTAPRELFAAPAAARYSIGGNMPPRESPGVAREAFKGTCLWRSKRFEKTPHIARLAVLVAEESNMS
jgi:hypothetical protein